MSDVTLRIAAVPVVATRLDAAGVPLAAVSFVATATQEPTAA
jgi:hypothetical protein